MSARVVGIQICILILIATTSCASNSERTQPANNNGQSAVSSSAPGVAVVQKVETETKAKSTKPFDACAMISSTEVASVVGQPVKDTKAYKPASDPNTPSFERWQCFYTVEPYDKSVSLELTRRHPSMKPDAVQEFWKKAFEQAKDKKDSEKPKPVADIGEQAFWVGDARTGALYVLKNDSFLRISRGGADAEPIKIKKLKSLAQNALNRL